LLAADAKMHAALGEFVAAYEKAIALPKSNWCLILEGLS
jgi:hypothetical protein